MSRTDFARIMDPERREHFVYRAFDADGDLIYVGCSHRPAKRMSEHKTNSTWYPHMVHVRLAGPFTYAKARSIEKAAINSENPRFNGHSPENLRIRRRRIAFVKEHIEVALKHGEDYYAAARLAVLAADSMTPGDAA